MISFPALMSKAAELDVPLGVHWTLTHACNLACGHCYQPSHRAGPDELSTAEAERVLGELRDAGVLFLTFSGGEVFARCDFLTLLRSAREKKFGVCVYTNGTRIDEARARALAEAGVLRVEVSVYASAPEGHDGFVGRAGAWEATRRAVDLLAREGVPVVVKTSVTSENAGDCARIEAMFARPGVSTTHDEILFPRDDGDPSPLAHRAGAEERRALVRRELDALEARALTRLAARLDADPRGRAPATCAAGRSSVAIQPNGDVTPCTIWPRVLGNLRRASFLDIWRGRGREEARRATVHAFLDASPECGGCAYGAVCGFCPALSWRETGSETGRSPSACERTVVRWGEVERRLGRTPRPPPPPTHRRLPVLHP